MRGKPRESSYRDRTHEFFSVAESQKESISSVEDATLSKSSSSVSVKPEDRRSAVAVQSEFNKRASRIGFGIHQTSQKLAKLTKRECRSNIFVFVCFYVIHCLNAFVFLLTN